MTLRKKVASALSFAHLTGFAKAEVPDDEDKKAKGEGDDPKDQDREDGNVKKGKKAKGEKDEKDDVDAEDEGPDEDDEEDKKKAKGAKADNTDDGAEDDDSDDEMRGKSASAAARRRERARCAAIFGSKAAGKNPALAANLAFNTSMSRKEALVVLENTPAAASGNYGDRAARNPGIGSGGALQQSTRQASAASLDAAFKKVAPRR